MKNKRWILGLYILAVMLIAGCGNQPQKTEEKQDSQTAEETPAETEAESPEGEPQTVDGTIRSFTGGYLSILDEKGDLQGFDLGDAELACKNGIIAGEEVTLEYVSEEDELTHEEVPRLLKVSDRKDARKLEEETMSGTVLDASPNTLTIQGIGDNGRDIITFFTVGTEFHCENGIGPDDAVVLTYRGDLQGSNARNVKVLSVTDAAPSETIVPSETAVPEGEDTADAAEKADEISAGELPAEADGTAEETAADEPKGKKKETTGSIVRVDGTILVAELADEPDEEREFDLTDAKIDLRYGLLEGSEVILTYVESAGEDAKESADGTSAMIPLLSLADVDPEVVNESTGGFTITGTVMATGLSTMTVTSDDGAQITCTTEDTEIADDSAGFLREGAYVVVVIEPDSNSNVYRALSAARAY